MARRLSSSVMLVCLGAVLAVAPSASAQSVGPVKPYFMIGCDTSGSMSIAVGNPPQQASCGYGTTRIAHARCALKNVMQAYAGRANFGLASFARQQSSCSGACFTGCTYSNFPGNSGADGCGPEPNPAAPHHSSRAGANILVPMLQDLPSNPPSNLASLVSWVDNNCASSQELFANGATPINGMLRDMYRYYSNQWAGPSGSPIFPSPLTSVANGEQPCRSVNVILIVDGEETCDTLADDIDAAAALLTGFTRDGIAWHIKTYVVAFAGANIINCNMIAAAGGTVTAFAAANEVQLTQALVNIVDQTLWAPVGSGVNNTVKALAIFDDGSGGGPALFAGGLFTSAGGNRASHIARWNGAAWSALGSPINGTSGDVNALAVFDDGAGGGPALYAGGLFTTAGSVNASNIARWNGTAWTALGAGTNGVVNALCVFDDDGPGPHSPALYAGGTFNMAGTASASNIARWDGANWTALGSGVTGTSPAVNALTVYNDGSGAALYAGGHFNTAGGGGANQIARWNGSTWSAVGAGLGTGNSLVNALAAHTDATGTALYAGGSFSNLITGVAKWNGASWVTLNVSAQPMLSLLDFNDGFDAYPALFVSGTFFSLNLAVNSIARWNGAFWSPLDAGLGPPGSPGTGYAMTAFGSPPRLYIGGNFTSPASRIAQLTFIGDHPSITGQPASRTVNVGQTVGFTVNASDGSLTYQWRRNGVDLSNSATISGTTTNTLAISPVALGDAGQYDCAVSNGCGATLSAAATLTVLNPCAADIAPAGGNGTVSVDDLLAVITNWGPCPAPPAPCAADIAPPGGNGVVNVDDLLLVITHWGPCP